MRIQKVPRSKTAKKQVEGVNGFSVLERHAQLVWRDNAELLLASNKETLEQLYIQHVMSPLLGPKHVDAGVCFFTCTSTVLCVEIGEQMIII